MVAHIQVIETTRSGPQILCANRNGRDVIGF